MKIIVGAKGTRQNGWMPLEQTQLDITSRENWQRLFQPESLDAVLAEHVLEHLTPAQNLKAMQNAFQFLKPNGYFRIAVPDGFHPDEKYVDFVRPVTGFTPDHKVLFNVRSLTQMLLAAGFSVVPLEWFDSRGIFHRQQWKTKDGFIHRCQNCLWSKMTALLVGAEYTSLIVDAVKIERPGGNRRLIYH